MHTHFLTLVYVDFYDVMRNFDW